MSHEPFTPLAQMNDAQWRRVRDIVEELERQWRAGSRPDWKSLAPPPGDPVRGAALVELAKVDLEYSWHSGERRAVEQYLRDAAEFTTAAWARRELVETECVTRAFLDALPDPRELHERFPDLAPKIDLEGIRRQAKFERETMVRVGPPQGDTSEDTTCPTQIAAGNTPVPPPSIGQKLGDRYEILGVLGKGGMGAVYRARDAKLEREVALKIPQFDNTSDARARERFTREARAAACIDHPNVCRIYDAGEMDGHLYITMALVDGGSLARRLKAGPLAPVAAAEMMVKLLDALAAIHEQGIIHRDLKPSNVIIDRSGEPHLTDFGLARWSVAELPESAAEIPTTSATRAAEPHTLASGMTCLTLSELAPGTLQYMAPEQFERKPADRRSDIYSMGLVLHEMLTGHRLFDGSHDEIVEKVRRGPPAPGAGGRGVDAALERICLTAMARDPEARYQSAREMQEALQFYLDRRRTRVRRIALTVAMAAFLTACGFLLYLKTGQGLVRIEVSEPDVALTIDGERISFHSPRDKIEIGIGLHELSVAKDGFRTETRSFRIRRGGTTELRVDMLPLAGELAGVKTVVSDLTAAPGAELFHDDFSGPELDTSTWRWATTDKLSFPGTAGQSYRVQQDGGILDIETQAPLDPDGKSCVGFVWLDSLVDLRSDDDIEILLRLSGRVQHGHLAVAINDGSEPTADPDPQAVTLFELRAENNVALEDQYIAISIYGSVRRATVWTVDGPRYRAANLDLSALGSWQLRFLALAGSSSGTSPGRASWAIDEVRVRRIPGRSGILGRVVDERLGWGIEEATVRAGPGISATTRADGTFSLLLAPGRHELQALADDYALIGPRTIDVSAGRRKVVDLAMRLLRFGYGDPIRSYQLAGDSVLSVAVAPEEIYYVAAVGHDPWLFRQPKAGGPPVRICCLRDAEGPLDRGLAWFDGRPFMVGAWPMRLYELSDGNELSLVRKLDIDWPNGLAQDGRQWYFWFHANNPDHRPQGVHSLDIRTGVLGDYLPAVETEYRGLAWGNGKLWLSTADGYVFEVDLAIARQQKSLEAGFVRRFRAEFTALTFADGLLWGLDPKTSRLWSINISDKPIPAQ